MLFGIANKMILLLCPFVERTLIRYVLGEQYLGLNSLFSSILSVLSLSELGFGTAIVYNMYKPVAQGDVTAVNALLAFYRKAYRIVGTVIFAGGLVMLPFLDRFIAGTHPADINIYLLYLIYLFNTSISYFLSAYLTSIITVYQREDIKSNINSAVRIGLTLAQTIVLLVTRKYFYMICLLPVFTVISNLWTAAIVKRNYPDFHCEGSISAEKKTEISKLVAGTFIRKVCNVTRNSLDSICISAFLGLTLTAIYGNYYQISSSISGVVGLISASFVGGVGNHVAIRSVEENYEELKKLDFVYLLMGGWCAVCLLCLYQPFMELWMGRDMLLPFRDVVLFCVYFYILRFGDVRTMYSSANGLWWEQRWRAVFEAALNIVLNIGLGKFFGVDGIILATIISILIGQCIWSTRITFKHYFGLEYLKDYYLYQTKYTAVTVCVGGILYFVCRLIRPDSLILVLILRAAMCVTLLPLLYFLAYRKNKYFTYAMSRIRLGR